MELLKTFLSFTRVNAAAVHVTEQHKVVSNDHTVTLASSLLPLPAMGRSCIFLPDVNNFYESRKLHLFSHLLKVIKELQGNGEPLCDQTTAFCTTSHEPEGKNIEV